MKIKDTLVTSNSKKHLNLLCDIGDLAALLSTSADIEIFLQRTVVMVAQHLSADVCSIYLYDENCGELFLKATIGLNPEAVNRIRMKPGEGLVGTSFQRLEPICEASASSNPNFRLFKEADEERFESFLAVPIRRGIGRIGVLVLQHEKTGYFEDIDIMALKAIASQLAGAIENARLLINLDLSECEPAHGKIPEDLYFIKGESASAGFALAAATVVKKSHGILMSSDLAPDINYSLKDFFEALNQTIRQLEELQSNLSERLPESAALIFSAHFMILKDRKFIDKIVEKISAGISPFDAVKSVAKHYIDFFLSSDHAYIREKASDMEDLAGRILKNFPGRFKQDTLIEEGRIVIAGNLYPSEILKLAKEDVRGIILVSGGVTSHVAILARSMKIPLVIANRPELMHITEGTSILLDADIGNIFVKPSPDVINHYGNRKAAQEEAASLQGILKPRTLTADGHRINLLANINLLSELKIAKDLQAEGVGLYRTEFPFLIRTNFPSEEEQYQIYKRLLDEMEGRIVTIRTLDVGGDKMLAYSDASAEANPELGLRSIRFSLRHPDIFWQQIRAILRAGANTEKLRIMFPMISSVDEFKGARNAIKDCVRSLERQRMSFHPNPEIGMMIELPSISEIIEDLAEFADFFSIGSNDFVQYMLAVDRTNQMVADYYRPEHPSVLRALSKIVKAVLTHDKDISICGEMAHEPEFIPFLIGIGISTLSVDTQFLLSVQEQIGQIKISDAKAYTRKLLGQSTIRGVHEVLMEAGEDQFKTA
jgi:phosphotransferase system enzyme I (PtsP)